MKDHEAAYREFLNRVWRKDIFPLIASSDPLGRRKFAVRGAQVAAAAGMTVDKVLGLRGRPFTRAFTVVGGTLGAVTPDLWDWNWVRAVSRSIKEEVVQEKLDRGVRDLKVDEALAVFGLEKGASREEITRAWRVLAKKWHPDHAPDDSARLEYAMRFKTYSAIYEQLCAARDAESEGQESRS
ncbi:MAG: J domain-containing protein [Phycisphaerae bacterium]